MNMEQEVKYQKMSDVINDYLCHCKIEKNLEEKTIKAYRTDLNQCVEFCGNVSIADLSKEIIRSYLRSISSFRYKTIKRKIASLRALLHYYECENEWWNNPLRRMQIKMREPKRLPTVMTIDEIKTILGVVYSRLDNCVPKTFGYMMAVRNVAIIELLFVSGIRVSELCDLRLCDVNLSCGRLRIVGKGDKERIVDICQRKTLKILKEWIVFRADAISSNEPFFTSRLGKKLSPQSVRWLVRDVVMDLGIEKHITPHTFRHTFATLLLEEDVDITYIQQLLGHSSIVTTQIYTHVNLQKQHEILSKKHPRRLI